ncbi:hypothetical protein [Glycomyces sp. YM15]|uniref:hypothetical protein n=1 Tax=Glycomyces sp. YM15 TaxID=2800446 RepID=UPI001962973F|nr:hypothetical protein [Glycomyces sp. YM15]
MTAPQPVSDLYGGLIREVVEVLAPNELPIVDAAIALKRRRRRPRWRPRSDRVGFGWSEAVVLLAPVVWVAVEKIAKGAADSLGERIAQLVLRLFRRSKRRQVDKDAVRKIVRKVAAEYGVNDDDAERITDEIWPRLPLHLRISGDPVTDPAPPDESDKPEPPEPAKSL